MTYGQLEESVLKDQLANYFEFAQAFGKLSEEGHILCTESSDQVKRYSLSPSGKHGAFRHRHQP